MTLLLLQGEMDVPMEVAFECREFRHADGRFPAAARILSAGDFEEIGREMAARRSGRRAEKL